MNYNLLYAILLCFSAICSPCRADADQQWDTIPGNEENQNYIVLKVNDDIKYQTVDHFGASDAWSTQFVGNWPARKREAIADLLFSRELDEAGNPEGIGLSLWRFNIGAGSAEQGANSGISDEWRRAESFLKADGRYDWQKQQGRFGLHRPPKKEVWKIYFFSPIIHQYILPVLAKPLLKTDDLTWRRKISMILQFFWPMLLKDYSKKVWMWII